MARNTKTVDYSQFLELDNDDEDFASSAPLTKKARVETKREKKEKPTKKTHRQENTSPKNSQGKRVPLDEKLYQRDLGVALALSVQKTTAVVENNENTPPNEASTYNVENHTDAEVSFSNCSVDSSTLGLDEITDGNEELVIGRSRRQAASKALAEQRKLLTDDSGDEEAADDFKPDAADVDSESDSSYSGEDEEFEIKKPKKISTHKVAKQNVKGGKKDKDSPKPKTAAAPSSTTVSIKINPTQAKAAPVISPAPAKQTVLSSKPVGMKRPAWTPPASSEMVSSLLGGGAVRSPNQGLRLGLSRLARVKPLHPEAVIR
ncbi:RAD51-associated protein 1 isoform X2 [Pseudophryne corroboree]|uniref:RAD51-associated protein 1 isoform X2 n=1 Tax=Pseudophryne corroboree TaxID=495146 RepID=UPI0030813D3D